MRDPSVYFKRLSESAVIPTRGTPGSAGLDLYAASWPYLDSNGRRVVDTDIAVQIPPGWQGEIRPRSSGPAVRIGTIDSDYRGGLKVRLEERQNIAVGDRIAQLVITPCHTGDIFEVDELDPTTRGAGGFGSTGR